MKKIIVIFGTRPEAIKLCPVIMELKKYSRSIKTVVCVTGQHKEMLEKVLHTFNVVPDYNLHLMKINQSLIGLTSSSVVKIGDVLDKEKPDLVVVQGDTTTTFTAALAAYYKKINVAHVEAGLRSNNIYSPYPEEMNRKMTSLIAKIHFAPTETNKKNLMREGINKNNILITGNTVIDSLLWMKKKILSEKKDYKELRGIDFGKKLILVTGHRRENFGNSFKNICNALKYLAEENDIEIVYPVHLNPNVRKHVFSILNNTSNIKLIQPLDYQPFLYLMTKCYFIITDSGGIQEEAPTFHKPLLITRDVTEREEVIKLGAALLVGTKKNNIIEKAEKLIYDENFYAKMCKVENPYGDGKSSKRIANRLINNL